MLRGSNRERRLCLAVNLERRDVRSGPLGDDVATAEGVSGFEQHTGHGGAGAGTTGPADVPAHEIADPHLGGAGPGLLQRKSPARFPGT